MQSARKMGWLDDMLDPVGSMARWCSTRLRNCLCYQEYGGLRGNRGKFASRRRSEETNQKFDFNHRFIIY